MRASFVRALIVPLLGVCACEGRIGFPHGGGDNSPTGSGTQGAGGMTGGAGVGASGTSTGTGTGTGTSTGTGTGTGGGPPSNCTAPQAPALHARMLTPSQYNNTVQTIVKVGGNPSKDFGGGVDTKLDDLGAERRANAAADIARQAATTLTTWFPSCVPPAMPAATCESQIIDKIGARAYRHPLSSVEHTQLQTLFDAGVKEKDFATGVEWFLTGLLQTPDFLYQFAKPAAGEKAGTIVALPSFEIASRLSYFLWNSLPDDALFTAATSNQLGDSAQVRQEVDRMMADPQFMQGVTGFYTAWLQADTFGEVARDDKGFTTDLVNALKTSLLMSATQLYSAPNPNVASLFTGQTYYMNDALRAFYGLTGTATGFTPTALPGEGRSGILTHPALMAMFARPDQTNPISRGLFVRQTLMCQDMPPPPDNITIPPLPDISPNLSTRERLDQHASVALCAGCHSQFDPPGYAFESFDQVGRRRTMDGGKAIDSSGNILDGGDLEGPFANGDEFLQRISRSTDVKSCFAQQYFQYAIARPAAPEDQCSVDQLKRSFAPSGDLKELVATIATSDSFRYRTSEGGTP